MKLSTAFPSKYLKASDLNDQDLIVTIRDCDMEDIGIIGKKEVKPVLYFKETAKGLVLNKTNASVIEKLYGDDTDAWLGKPIALWPNHDIEFQGEVVSAIRVRAKAPVADAPRAATAGRVELEDKLMDLVLLAVDGDVLKIDDYMLKHFKVAAIGELSDAKLRLVIKSLEPK